MDDQRRSPIRFSHLSIGFQLLLIATLIGSCAGNADTVSGVRDDSSAQAVSFEVRKLEQEVRALRRELHHQRATR